MRSMWSNLFLTGIRCEKNTLAQTVTLLRGRPRGSSSFPKGGGVSLGPGPGWTAGRGALGLAVTRGDPKTSSQPRSQRSPSARLKWDTVLGPRPEGECVRVCV